MCTWEPVNSASLFYKFLLKYATSVAEKKEKRSTQEIKLLFFHQGIIAVCMCECMC